MSRIKKAASLADCLECLRRLATRLGGDEALQHWKDELLVFLERTDVHLHDSTMYKQALADLDKHLDKMPVLPGEIDNTEWLSAANNFSRARDPCRFEGPLVAELQSLIDHSPARKRDRLKNWRAERRSQRVSLV